MGTQRASGPSWVYIYVTPPLTHLLHTACVCPRTVLAQQVDIRKRRWAGASGLGGDAEADPSLWATEAQVCPSPPPRGTEPLSGSPRVDGCPHGPLSRGRGHGSCPNEVSGGERRLVYTEVFPTPLVAACPQTLSLPHIPKCSRVKIPGTHSPAWRVVSGVRSAFLSLLPELFAILYRDPLRAFK